MSIPDDKYKESLKHGAEFLLKGGTLLAEPCEKCSGIQVKKNNEISCIICGNTTTLEEPRPTKPIDRTEQSDFSMSEKIGKRLIELVMSIGSDKNLDEEEKRLRVIDGYIKVLEKIKFLK
jgi:uncharacterized Zn finger protein (UPF0148 family)